MSALLSCCLVLVAEVTAANEVGHERPKKEIFWLLHDDRRLVAVPELLFFSGLLHLRLKLQYDRCEADWCCRRPKYQSLLCSSATLP